MIIWCVRKTSQIFLYNFFYLTEESSAYTSKRSLTHLTTNDVDQTSSVLLLLCKQSTMQSPRDISKIEVVVMVTKAAYTEQKTKIKKSFIK